MKLPEYEIDKEWVDKESPASLYVNKIKWFIIISFLTICAMFGSGIGHGLGEMFGKEIVIVNEKNEARRVKIIPLDNQ